MKLRLDKASSNAAAIAAYLRRHPLVQRVNYAGLPGTPEAELNSKCALHACADQNHLCMKQWCNEGFAVGFARL